MKPMRRPSLYVLSLLILGACVDKGPELPATLPELATLAAEQPKLAEAARGQKSVDEARAAAKLAARAAESAEKLATDDPLQNPILVEIRRDARSAKRFADLTEEDERLVGLTTGLRARAYKSVRDLGLAAVYKGFALAADQAGEADWESLRPEVQDAALSAARLALDSEVVEVSEVDWSAVAKAMRAAADETPLNTHRGLWVAFGLALRTRTAFLELELYKDQALAQGEDPVLQGLVRVIFLAVNDCPELAMEQCEALGAAVAARDRQAGTALAELNPEVIVGAIHLTVAVIAARRKDYGRAEQELIRATRVWPNNPVSVFVTGQRLADSGRYEEAAESLEKAAAGSEFAWAAEEIAAHTRELRDEKGEVEPLLSSKTFMLKLILHTLSQAAERSPRLRAFNEQLDALKARGRAIIERIPGLGGDEEK